MFALTYYPLSTRYSKPSIILANCFIPNSTFINKTNMNLLRKLLLCSFVLLLCTSVRAQGIEFFHGTWDEALVKAEAEDKLIFVDAYASWCGPCKAMAKNVFPVVEVGSYFNSNFINMKFDMEKEESIEFRKTHQVSAYPTLLFINAKNEVVHKAVGGKKVKTLIGAGNSALAKMDDVEAYAASWEAGDRDSKLAFKYIRGLIRQEEPHARVANDYLRSQTDLTTEDNLNILLVAATNADSRIFDLLVENKDAAIAQAGKEVFDAQINRAIMATKDKAIEYKDENLLASAVSKLSKINPAESKKLALQGAFELAAKGSESKDFLKATKKYVKGADGDVARLYRIYQIASISKFISDEKVFDLAVQAGSAAAAGDLEKGFEKYFRLADFLRKQGKTDMALTYANLSLNAIKASGKAQPKYERAISGLIQKIEQGK